MSNVSGRSWPSKRLPDQFGAPSNAAVGSVPDLPKPRNSAAATQAMDVLADAVWRIDARDHQNSGAPAKVVRNLGTGGSVLDCRTGSTSVPDTNDPLFLPVEQRAYVYLPGVTGNYMGVAPTTTAGSIWSVTIRMNYTNANYVVPFSKGSANLTSYNIFGDYASVAPRITWMDGTNTQRDSGYIGSRIPSGARWYRFTVDASAADTVVTVEYAADAQDEPSSWTSHGSVTAVGRTGLTPISGNCRIGELSYGLNYPLTGNVYRVIERIDGTTVLDVDTSVLTSGSATSFTAVTGQTVTINRSTSGRKTVVVVGGPVWLFGTDDYMEVPASATGSKLLDFGPNDSFTVLAVVRQWATVVNGGNYISKWDGTNNFGWTLRSITGGLKRFDIYGQTTASAVNTATGVVDIASGSLSTANQTRNLVSQQVLTTARYVLPGTLINNYPMMLGRSSSFAAYQDFEGVAFAVWRRALSAAEIQTLTAYYGRVVA